LRTSFSQVGEIVVEQIIPEVYGPDWQDQDWKEVRKET
jgi:hypothetical protein